MDWDLWGHSDILNFLILSQSSFVLFCLCWCSLGYQKYKVSSKLKYPSSIVGSHHEFQRNYAHNNSTMFLHERWSYWALTTVLLCQVYVLISVFLVEWDKERQLITTVRCGFDSFSDHIVIGALIARFALCVQFIKKNLSMPFWQNKSLIISQQFLSLFCLYLTDNRVAIQSNRRGEREWVW